MEETKARADRYIIGRIVDKEGKVLFTCDSFGFRGQIPGESDACYALQVERMSAAMPGPDD